MNRNYKCFRNDRERECDRGRFNEAREFEREFESNFEREERLFNEQRIYENGYCSNNGSMANVFNQNRIQRHVHELEESVKLAEMCPDRHNHRTAAVTGQAIFIGNGNHVHKVDTRTDFLDHFHRIDVFTGPALFIPGTNKHIHLVRGFTSVNDGHRHAFLFTTQIEAPLV